MNLLELLRSQARRYRCPVCSENMADCDIKVLAQQGNHALVRVRCSRCSDENLLQIVFQASALAEGEEAASAPRRAVVDEGLPEDAEPISADEVLDFRTALDAYQGDLRSLVERS